MSLAVAAEAGGAHPAPGALDPNSAYAGQSGMQGGALRVVADPEQLEKGSVGRKLAEGFGPGNVVSAGGYQAIQQQILDQRQANQTGKKVTSRGGSGGIPGGGGAAISRTTTPSYGEHADKVNGKVIRVPQPVFDKYRQLMEGINQSAMASTNNASPTSSPANQMAIRRARTAARAALSDENKSFLALYESGAGPKAFGFNVANKGRVDNTGNNLPPTYTTSAPHPLSDAAKIVAFIVYTA
ncbi:MAG TPA: hypothetical protein VNA25_19115, partial [Phycisphaerae bacterium]|nr:hypothetical protein [Phycisphaerae bacterium]